MKFLEAWKERRRQNLIAIAWPALEAWARDPQMAECWGRSIDRLWLDHGGSIRGFMAGVRLGWMEFVRDRDGDKLVINREYYGRLTDAGRAYYQEESQRRRILHVTITVPCGPPV